MHHLLKHQAKYRETLNSKIIYANLAMSMMLGTLSRESIFLFCILLQRSCVITLAVLVK